MDERKPLSSVSAQLREEIEQNRLAQPDRYVASASQSKTGHWMYILVLIIVGLVVYVSQLPNENSQTRDRIDQLRSALYDCESRVSDLESKLSELEIGLRHVRPVTRHSRSRM